MATATTYSDPLSDTSSTGQTEGDPQTTTVPDMHGDQAAPVTTTEAGPILGAIGASGWSERDVELLLSALEILALIGLIYVEVRRA